MNRVAHSLLCQLTLSGAVCLVSTAVAAQTTPEAPATAPAPEAAPTTPAEPAPAEPAPAVTVAATAEVAPPTTDAPPPPAEAPPVAEAPAAFTPKLNIGAWIRAGLVAQDPTNPKSIGDLGTDAIYGELHFSGNLTEKIGYTLNFNANGLNASANIMDAIAQFDFAPAFHVWMGQLLVPSDRSNFSGPFFMSTWNYPGIYGSAGYIQGPHAKYFGRDAGVVTWGDFGEGKFKYYLSAMNLTNPAQHPLYSGRLGLALIGKEPGYYGSSTYYGSQDVLALGIYGQYQNDGSTVAGAGFDDYKQFGADLLGEFGVGSGVITGEAAYYHSQGDAEVTDDAYFLLASFLTPEVGVGKLQPLLRWQQAFINNSPDMYSTIDAQLSYVLKGYALRGALNFQHVDLDSKGTENKLQLGIQMIL